MKLLNITPKSQYTENIKRIYIDSFPESERMDFEDVENLKAPNSRLLGVFKEGKLIGFSYVSVSGKYAYIIYLAIDKNERNKNYGSQVLKKIDDLFKNKTKVLCVEKPISENDIQTRRINFYKRNGFTLADFEFEYLGQYYYSMYHGAFDKQAFINFLLVCFHGCKDFKEIRGYNIDFELVSKDNIEKAIKIQHEIFPLENGSEDLKETVNNSVPSHQSLQKYWLVKDNNRYIGISGLYAYKAYPKDAWLGWFGVLENERHKGYATKILEFTIHYARQLGFESLRLYTDEEDNTQAINLYKKFGMISEPYNNPEDVHFEISKTLIFSTSLTKNPTTLWNNKNLHLGAHDEKNNT